jgi:hypothetical protein
MISQSPIAVVIVCRNAREALARTLDSLRALADPRLSVIVIDGASGDGTAEWLSGCLDFPHWSCSEPDQGIFDAMNKGWRRAPANAYVIYLGAGDHLLKLPADEGLRDPQGHPVPLVIGDCQTGSGWFHSRWTRELRWRNTAHHQAMLVHKSVHPEPPFDASLQVYADWDFNLRLWHQGVQALHTSELRASAEPGGASWHHQLGELRLVAQRHGGPLHGMVSWILNGGSLARRLWQERRAAHDY